MHPLGPGRIDVCVIGTGRISEEHFAYLAQSSRTRVVGVCDLDLVLAERAAESFPRVTATTDHQSMLSSLRPDSVHILTPVASHRQLVTDCLAAGVKSIIIEKPAGDTLAATEAMVMEVERAGATLTEDHNYRFNQPVLRLASLAGDGTLGSVREVDIRMSMDLGASRYDDPFEQRMADLSPAGVLREFLPHLAYLALLFNPRVTVRHACWDKHDPRTSVRPDDLDALLEGPGGAGARIRVRFSSRVAPETTSITVRGTRGWAEADLQVPSLRVSKPRAVGDALSPLVDHAIGGISLVGASLAGFVAKLRGSPIYSGIGTFLDETYAAFAGGTPPPVQHADLIGTARVVDDLTKELHR